MSRIVTVTPNPALDLTLEVERLGVGAVNIAAASRFESGGKGANVARMLAHLGTPGSAAAVVALPADGADSWIASFPRDVELVVVRVAGSLRANVAITAADGETTKVNMRGGPLSLADADALLAAVAAAARGAAGVVVGGSLPIGMEPAGIGRVARAARAAGAKIAIDCTGEALEAAVAARVDLIKPNEEEATHLVGFPVNDRPSAERAASLLIERGVGSVLLSLGASGAIYRAAESDTTLYAPTPRAKVRSTVGAGDVLLAALLFTLSSGGSPADALNSAVGWAAAKVEQPGTTMPTEPLRGA
jgi:1-phosphofructokinase family hexose kinase